MTVQAARRTLYVSDLDYTLLRSDGTLGRRSVDILNRAIEDGVLFTCATARSPQSARVATHGLRLRLPAITYGGTVMADAVTGEASDIRYLLPDVVVAALRAAEGHPQIAPIIHTFENGRDWIRWDPAKPTRGVMAFLSRRVGDRRLRAITVADPLDMATVHYVSVLGNHEDLVSYRAVIRTALAQTAHFLSAYPVTPDLHWLEFHDPAGTKALAVRRLMSGLSIDRLVVFGDNHNDVPMFEVADEAYAVRNAAPEVAAIATAVIGHHDDDAVARFISDDIEREAATSRA